MPQSTTGPPAPSDCVVSITTTYSGRPDRPVEVSPVIRFAKASAVRWRWASIGSVGGSQPHTNFQPYLCIDFIISLFGIFPSPT